MDMSKMKDPYMIVKNLLTVIFININKNQESLRNEIGVMKKLSGDHVVKLYDV